MIKNPGRVRDLVIKDASDMLRHLRVMLTMEPDTEVDVMLQLEQPQVADIVIDITNLLMTKFGHEAKPTDPRYCKTKRAYNKRNKGLRGGNTFDSGQERKKALGALSAG